VGNDSENQVSGNYRECAREDLGIQDKSANILQIVTKIQLKYKLVLIGLLPNPTITTGIVPNSNDKTKCTPLQGAEANQKDPAIIFGS
jgi:hypothetical protein